MRYLSISALCLLFFSMSAWANYNDCLIEKYDAYNEAKIFLNTSVNNLVVKMEPKYKDVSALYTNDQLRSVKMNQIAFLHLLKNSPDQLKLSERMNSWLPSQEEYKVVLMSENADYARLCEEDDAVMSRKTHPDGDSLRDFMRKNIISSDEYRDLMINFQTRLKAAEDLMCSN